MRRLRITGAVAELEGDAVAAGGDTADHARVGDRPGDIEPVGTEEGLSPDQGDFFDAHFGQLTDEIEGFFSGKFVATGVAGAGTAMLTGEVTFQGNFPDGVADATVFGHWNYPMFMFRNQSCG